MTLLLETWTVLGSISPTLPAELTLGKSLLYVAGIIFFLLLNAFFVASEFAIVKVRSSQLEALGGTGDKRVLKAIEVTENLEAYLSATQLGITLASLALGWVGESLLAGLIWPLLIAVGVEAEGVLKAV